jgi:hypothetical protein
VSDEVAKLLLTPYEIDGWVRASQSADAGRKGRGAYATPLEFAYQLAEATLHPLCSSKHFIRVTDPSAGAGALLIASFLVLTRGKSDRRIAGCIENLYGTELDAASRELCCLLLWIVANRREVKLSTIQNNIRVENAITAQWWDIGRAPFDAAILNPPWESLRHQTGTNDPTRPERLASVERMSVNGLGDRDLPPLYSAQGTGDRNLFKAFVELAPHLVREGGRIGALIPAAFASDLGMAPLRTRYFDQLKIDRWTSFENQRRYFPIDSRYKFGLITATRCKSGTESFAVRSFALDPIDSKSAHFVITRSQLTRIGGSTMMLPEFSSEMELKILAHAIERGQPLFSSSTFGRVIYRREVDLTVGLKNGEFRRFEKYRRLSPQGDGSFVSRQGERFVPLLEGRLVGQYDFFQKSWISGNGRRARWELNANRSLRNCRPQFLAPPRIGMGPRVAICDVTSSTNMRTVHATLVPDGWVCGNTAPTLAFGDMRRALVAVGIMNSMVFDWITRRLVAGLHLNKFYLDMLVWPTLTPDAVTRIERASMGICLQNRRHIETGQFGFLAGAHSADYVEAHSVIETEVANGFGLTLEMLHQIYDADRLHRRGFWRFFEAEPRALEVVARVLRRDPTGNQPHEKSKQSHFDLSVA